MIFHDERAAEWIALCTYARAAGALGWDEAAGWARVCVSEGAGPPEMLFRRIDDIAKKVTR